MTNNTTINTNLDKLIKEYGPLCMAKRYLAKRNVVYKMGKDTYAHPYNFLASLGRIVWVEEDKKRQLNEFRKAQNRNEKNNIRKNNIQTDNPENQNNNPDTINDTRHGVNKHECPLNSDERFVLAQRFLATLKIRTRADHGYLRRTIDILRDVGIAIANKQLKI